MKLTPFGKAFLALVIIGVVGFVVFKRFGSDIKSWAGGAGTGRVEQVTQEDFKELSGQALADAPRTGQVAYNNTAPAAPTGSGKLSRPLVVAINTWAGHAPGIVANGGLEPGSPASHYKKQYGLDVRFVLIEDPVAKLNAFIKGDVDIMWDTVDSFANEASRLAEQNIAAKAIVQEDWSRGGDGIVSVKAVKSIEDLRGKKVATTQFTPSHFFLLYMLSQSGLTPDERAGIERNLVLAPDAPSAASMFKSKRVDAAVTWEPDLSSSVAARPDEAHILVSTMAATHVIADTLVARQQLIDQAPETVRDFVAGWLDGIEFIKENPEGTHQVVGSALKLTPEDVSGMLSGLKLTPYADNAQFFGLAGPKPYFDTLFNSAFVIWRKKGVVTKVVDGKDWRDSRFVAALGERYREQQVEESFAFKDKPNVQDRAIVNKSLSIHFTTGSDEIMPGSYFTLDSLGETMLSFGNTFLRVEGNTDARGSAAANKTLSQRRAEAVKRYLMKNFALPEERFVAVGYGSANPVADNATEDGRALNRRTDIKVVLNAQ